MTEAEAIAKRIESFGAGRAFTAADFSDVAGRRNAANALGRLHAKGGIARAISARLILNTIRNGSINNRISHR